MRVERPAASTTAAMRSAALFRRRLGARLRPRDDFHQQPADAHAGDVRARLTGRPASSRISTQSKPFSFGERAQPGAPSTACPPQAADQHQVAGIDRHAEMLDLAADRFDAPPG